MKQERFRKRKSPQSVPGSEFSKKLRKVHFKIDQSENADALVDLNDLASGELTNWEEGKILCLAADSELKLGRFQQAAHIYSIAEENFRLVLHVEWFRASIGGISALLRDLKLREAYDKALEASVKADVDQKSFDALIDVKPGDPGNPNAILLPARPTRPTKILTRLGSLFLREGYPDTAEEFYQKALLYAPNGASRARQGLARIALSRGEFEEAERFSRESLQMGRFQAKTLHSWVMFFDARKRRGKTLHDPALYLALLKNGKTSVVHRAVLLIVSNLRNHADPAWETVATEWQRKGSGLDPVISVEISKIILAEAKISDTNPAAVAAYASSLLQEEMISGNEAVALAKTISTYGLRAGLDPSELEKTADFILRKYDRKTHDRAVHSMALGAMVAKGHIEARQLLTRQIDILKLGSLQWRKSLWALARMENALGNYKTSAAHYLTFAENPGTPPQFQIQGFLLWIDCCQKSGEAPDVQKTKAKLELILARVDDFKILLDAARQLALAGAPFIELTRSVVSDATNKALSAFDLTTNPKTALNILIQLSRRQYYDFGQADKIHLFWESLPPAKREWIWSQDSNFWEYQSLILNSYENSENTREADRLASALLEADTTPDVGTMHIAATYAEIWMKRGRQKQAYALFEKSVETSPTHRLAAQAWYWLALKSYKAGRKRAAADQATAIRRCFATKPALYWEWALDARAILLLGKISGKNKHPDESRYSASYLDSQMPVLESNLAIIP